MSKFLFVSYAITKHVSPYENRTVFKNTALSIEKIETLEQFKAVREHISNEEGLGESDELVILSWQTMLSE